MLMFAEVQGRSATETLRFKQALEAEQSLSNPNHSDNQILIPVSFRCDSLYDQSNVLGVGTMN